MKVIEHLEKAKETLFSYEIIPPLRGNTIDELLEIVNQLIPYNPPFIDVTSHSAEAYYKKNNKGIVKRFVKKKRPGTISICGIIQNRYQIDTVVHLLCRGFTREETEDALIELNYLGIHNILAIRGDETNYKKNKTNNRKINIYANDLVKQITDMNNGNYIDNISNAKPSDYCIGVAGYPEKHFEATSLQSDLRYLKKKVDSGADYIVTQMFFDNSHYFNFVDQCRKTGINIPIIPGLKVLTSTKQLVSLPEKFYTNLPNELIKEINENNKFISDIGKEWTIKQCEELLNRGVPAIHFYIMNKTKPILDIVDKLIL